MGIGCELGTHAAVVGHQLHSLLFKQLWQPWFTQHRNRCSRSLSDEVKLSLKLSLKDCICSKASRDDFMMDVVCGSTVMSNLSRQFVGPGKLLMVPALRLEKWSRA